jgi:hypothetical protein
MGFLAQIRDTETKPERLNEPLTHNRQSSCDGRIRTPHHESCPIGPTAIVGSKSGCRLAGPIDHLADFGRRLDGRSTKGST